MNKTILIIMLAIIGLSTAYSQVGIGTTTPAPSAILDLTATDKGFLPPRMTTAQRDAITAPIAEGLTIFNTTVGCIQFYQGTLWYDICEGGLTPGPTSDCATFGFIPPFLPANQTVVKEVTNPTTGETWMDRNLGAYTADRSTPGPAGGTDCWAYGNLYQWGRASDGHEYRDSGATATNATTAVPNAGNSWDGLFITETSSNFDWLTPQDDTLWQGVNGTNNPCPAGYRVPTEAELDAERSSWAPGNGREGAITSPLKLPVAGYGLIGSGSPFDGGNNGYYWSSTVSSTFSQYLNFGNNSSMVTTLRAFGYSVRCLKD